MKSISIHNLDDQMAKLIARQASEHGISMNKMIKRLLAESLGIKPREVSPNRDEFAEFFGVWNEQELKEFESRTADFGKVDTEDWQ